MLQPHFLQDTPPVAGNQDLLVSLQEWVSSQGPAALFWVASALIIPPFLPKGVKLPVFVVALSIGVLPGSLAFLVALLFLGIVLLKYGLQQIPEGNAALVLRLGKFSRILNSGINFIVPGLEVIARPSGLKTIRHTDGHQETKLLVTKEGYVSLKEEILDPPIHEMICSDNTVVNLDSIVYFQIMNPEMAAFRVKNLGDSMLKLTETVLRQEVGRLDGDAVIRSREIIGAKVQEALAIAAEPWGTRIVRVEIQEIRFADSVQDSLTKAREEELKGRAKVVEAERERDARVAKAEGEARAVKLAADAEFERRRLEAEGDFLSESRRREGEAAGLLAIAESLRSAPEAMIALEALKAQEKVAAGLGASPGLLVVPNEAAGLVGALGAVVSSMAKVQHGSNSGPAGE
jgi:regulator of protease activity HflC (stomatin/prohibitin superfamily)